MEVGNDAEIDFKYMARPAYSPGGRGQRVSVDFPRDTIHLQSEEWQSPALVLVAYNVQSWQIWLEDTGRRRALQGQAERRTETVPRFARKTRSHLFFFSSFPNLSLCPLTL